jgi:alpha-beta hydrolase superfamily lysophospholipase
MNKFVEFGFDVWAMDFEGYGRSSPSAGNSNVADGVEDLKAARKANHGCITGVMKTGKTMYLVEINGGTRRLELLTSTVSRVI